MTDSNNPLERIGEILIGSTSHNPETTRDVTAWRLQLIVEAGVNVAQEEAAEQRADEIRAAGEARAQRDAADNDSYGLAA